MVPKRVHPLVLIVLFFSCLFEIVELHAGSRFRRETKKRKVRAKSVVRASRACRVVCAYECVARACKDVFSACGGVARACGAWCVRVGRKTINI